MTSIRSAVGAALLFVSVPRTRCLPDRSMDSKTWSPSVHVCVAALAMPGNTPRLVAPGATELFDFVLVTAAVIDEPDVTFTFSDVPVAVIPVVPAKIEELTPGTAVAAGAVPKVVTAVAPRATLGTWAK